MLNIVATYFCIGQERFVRNPTPDPTPRLASPRLLWPPSCTPHPPEPPCQDPDPEKLEVPPQMLNAVFYAAQEVMRHANSTSQPGAVEAEAPRARRRCVSLCVRYFFCVCSLACVAL